MKDILDRKMTKKKKFNESDIDFIKKRDFDDKIKNINKKVTLNISKHVLVENELNELSEKVKLLLAKGYNFLLDRIYFTGNDGHQNFYQKFSPRCSITIIR